MIGGTVEDDARDLAARVRDGDHRGGYFALQPSELVDVLGEQIGELKDLRVVADDGNVMTASSAADFVSRVCALKMNAAALLQGLCDQAGFDVAEVETQLILAATEEAAASVRAPGVEPGPEEGEAWPAE